MTTPAWAVALDDVAFCKRPVILPDGSSAFCEGRQQTVSVFDGSRREVLPLPGVANGLALGPDKALYAANNGV